MINGLSFCVDVKVRHFVYNISLEHMFTSLVLLLLLGLQTLALGIDLPVDFSISNFTGCQSDTLINFSNIHDLDQVGNTTTQL